MWQGPLPITSLQLDTTLTADYGPDAPPPQHGVLCLGAVPWVTNYNILLDTRDLQYVSKLARNTSTRGGGLPAVEAMALVHDGGMWCNCIQGLLPDLPLQVFCYMFVVNKCSLSRHMHTYAEQIVYGD